MLHNRDGEQKSSRLFGLFSIGIFLFSSTLFGSFEDFKRQQDAQFKEYKDQRDAAFNKYLKEQWQEYTAKQGGPLYKKPKPKSIPKKAQESQKSLGPVVVVKAPKPEVQPLKEPEKKVDFIKVEIKDKEKPKPNDISADFFGYKLAFDVDNSVKLARFYPFSQVGIANYFDAVATSNYESLLHYIRDVQKELLLNDWGVYLLVDTIAHRLYASEDEAKLLSWFLLNKLGYNVKIGLAVKHVVLMHYSKKVIYSTPNYSFGGKKFYLLSEYAQQKTQRVYTYKQEYPGATKDLDLSLHILPKLPETLVGKNLSFSYVNKKYVLAFKYNKNLLDFMASYPQADYETFFNAPLQKRTYEEIASEIKEYVDGQKASWAINFVLAFVQNAFLYQRDDEQFGREKVMFAQETLVYDKSDCEDRAVLFAYLVKNLFGIGVVGVKYSDHMSTALNIPMQGDSVEAYGKKLVIADPTYINANIGQNMPQYKNKIPQDFIIVRGDN